MCVSAPQGEPGTAEEKSGEVRDERFHHLSEGNCSPLNLLLFSTGGWVENTLVVMALPLGSGSLSSVSRILDTLEESSQLLASFFLCWPLQFLSSPLSWQHKACRFFPQTLGVYVCFSPEINVIKSVKFSVLSSTKHLYTYTHTAGVFELSWYPQSDPGAVLSRVRPFPLYFWGHFHWDVCDSRLRKTKSWRRGRRGLEPRQMRD